MICFMSVFVYEKHIKTTLGKAKKEKNCNNYYILWYRSNNMCVCINMYICICFYVQAKVIKTPVENNWVYFCCCFDHQQLLFCECVCSVCSIVCVFDFNTNNDTLWQKRITVFWAYNIQHIRAFEHRAIEQTVEHNSQKKLKLFKHGEFKVES